MDERALLIVWRLSLATRWRGILRRARWRTALAVAGACIVAVVAFAAFARMPVSGVAFEWLTQHPKSVGLSAAFYALLFVARRRTHLRTETSQSWLLALPLSPRAFRNAAALRVSVSLLGHCLGLAVALSCVAVAHGLEPAALWSVIGRVAIGIAVGALVGSVWPQKREASRSEDSRFVRNPHASTTKPSLHGLSRWPIAKAIAWHRPENARVLFMFAAVSLPAGGSALFGLAVLVVWALGSYLFAIVRAVPQVAREASVWLRPTPLPFGAFAWAIGRRALAQQVIGTALLGALFILLGGRPASVASLAGLWLAVSSMVGMIGIRQSYFSLPSTGRTLVSALLVLAAELRIRGMGPALAAIVTIAHLRGVARERA